MLLAMLYVISLLLDNSYACVCIECCLSYDTIWRNGSPSKLRISTDLESQIEVTCLAFNPMINKLLLVGTAHGQLNLYTTARGKIKILLW
jgi:hypothetical protein